MSSHQLFRIYQVARTQGRNQTPIRKRRLSILNE